MAFFFLFVLLFVDAVQSVDKTISLTKTDGSFTMNGFLFMTYQNIIVENKDNTKGMIWVNSLQTVYGEAVPEVFINDDSGNQTAINVGKYFGPRLTVSLGRTQNYNFIIHFARSDETNRDNTPPYNIGLAPIDDVERTFYSSTDTNKTTVHTFIMTQAALVSMIECRVSEIKTNGCSIDLYLGGMPGDNGKGKYRLFTFTDDTILRYKSSYVRTYAATLVIPAKCASSYICKKSLGTNETAWVDENSMGFYVSSEYPGAFRDDQQVVTMTNAWSDYRLWTAATNLTWDLVSVDAGKNGSLNIKCGDLNKTVTSLTTETTYTAIGNSYYIFWNPSDDKNNGFLARWTTSNGGVPQGSTSSPLTRTTPKSTSILSTISSVVFFLFTLVIRV